MQELHNHSSVLLAVFTFFRAPSLLLTPQSQHCANCTERSRFNNHVLQGGRSKYL